MAIPTPSTPPATDSRALSHNSNCSNLARGAPSARRTPSSLAARRPAQNQVRNIGADDEQDQGNGRKEQQKRRANCPATSSRIDAADIASCRLSLSIGG